MKKMILVFACLMWLTINAYAAVTEITALGVTLSSANLARANTQTANIATSTQALSSPHFLFKEVSQKKAEQIIEYNERSIKALTYFANNYKVVRLNSTFLENPHVNDKFELKLFDNGSVEFIVTDVRHSNSGNTTTIEVENTGSIFNGIEPADLDIENIGISRKQLLDTLRKSTFYILSWNIDLDTGNAYLTDEETAPVSIATPGFIKNKHTKNKQEKAFKSISGSFTLFPSGITYFLMPIDHSPRYHLFIERNQAAGDTYKSDGPEKPSERTLYLQNKYKNYLKTLPDEEKDKQIKGDF